MIIVAIAVFLITLWAMTRNSAPLPGVVTRQELEAEGLTPQEVRRELRAQRRELRDERLARDRSTRTANAVSRTAANHILRQIRQRNRITGV